MIVRHGSPGRSEVMTTTPRTLANIHELPRKAPSVTKYVTMHQKDNASQRVRRLSEREGDGFLQRHPLSLVAGLMLGRDRHAKGREPAARRGSRVRGCRQTEGGAQRIRSA